MMGTSTSAIMGEFALRVIYSPYVVTTQFGLDNPGPIKSYLIPCSRHAGPVPEEGNTRTVAMEREIGRDTRAG